MWKDLLPSHVIMQCVRTWSHAALVALKFFRLISWEHVLVNAIGSCLLNHDIHEHAVAHCASPHPCATCAFCRLVCCHCTLDHFMIMYFFWKHSLALRFLRLWCHRYVTGQIARHLMLFHILRCNDTAKKVLPWFQCHVNYLLRLFCEKTETPSQHIWGDIWTVDMRISMQSVLLRTLCSCPDQYWSTWRERINWEEGQHGRYRLGGCTCSRFRSCSWWWYCISYIRR